MTEAERVFLANVGHLQQSGNRMNLPPEVVFTAAGELLLQLNRNVEMVLDRVLSAARHENNERYTRSRDFFRRILDQRLVDERQHFLGLRLGGRQETRSKPRD